jgi:hypothetical protein
MKIRTSIAVAVSGLLISVFGLQSASSDVLTSPTETESVQDDGKSFYSCEPSKNVKGKFWITEYRKVTYSLSSNNKNIEIFGPSEVDTITKWVVYHRPESGGKWTKVTLKGGEQSLTLRGPGMGVEYGVVGYIENEKVCNVGYPDQLGNFKSFGWPGKYNDAAYKSAMTKSKADAIKDREWMKTQSEKICDPKGKCPIGSTGPGGGYIFYDAGSTKSWGRYLEVAPVKPEWELATQEDPAKWCSNDVPGVKGSNGKALKFKGTFSKAIGKGGANTKLMQQSCKSGAADATKIYDGGGKSDWILPSIDELSELMKFGFNEKKLFEGKYANPSLRNSPFYYKQYLRGDLKLDNNYWSSTPWDSKITSASYVSTFDGLPSGAMIVNNFSVRLIRYVK